MVLTAIIVARRVVGHVDIVIEEKAWEPGGRPDSVHIYKC